MVRKYSVRPLNSLKIRNSRLGKVRPVHGLEPLISGGTSRFGETTIRHNVRWAAILVPHPAGFGIVLELGTFLRSAVRRRSSLLAENLFLRKQLAFYQEHQIRPRRLTHAARLSLVFWSRLCNWKSALVIVKPETLIGWHRREFKLFWRLKSRPGRPKLPNNIRQLIARMVEENPTWGQGRVADELALKLGIRVSPRTVGAYWPNQPNRRGPSSQRWNSFVRNHTRSLLACDFLVVATAGFGQLCVFVLLEIGTRRTVYTQCHGPSDCRVDLAAIS